MLKKPVGVLQLLDEECQFPKASDKTFIEKITKQHEHCPFLEKSRGVDLKFAVHHYAGRVIYNAEGFLDKNRDQLRMDLEGVCLESALPYLTELIASGNFDDMMKKQTLRAATLPRSPSAQDPGSMPTSPTSPTATVRGGSASVRGGPAKSKSAGGKFEVRQHDTTG